MSLCCTFAIPGESYDLNHITTYGNALSKAITDIAVKDASILQSGDSFDSSVGDGGTSIEESVDFAIDGNGDGARLKEWSQFSTRSCVSENLLEFCEQLTQEVIISVISHKLPERFDDNGCKDLVSGMKGTVTKESKTGMLNTLNNFDNSVELRQFNKGTLQHKNNLTGLVDDLVASAVTGAINRKLGQPSPSDNGSVHSGLGSSLGDFSVISSTSAHSETYVKVHLDEYPDSGNRQLNMVESYVSGVIGQAVCIAKQLDNFTIDTVGSAGNDQSDSERQTSQDNRTHCVSSNGEPGEFSKPTGGGQPLLNGELKGDDVGSLSSLPSNVHEGDGAYQEPTLPPLRGPVVNIERGDCSQPGTPPPSPSFQQFDQSSRSSFSEADLLIFGEELLHLQNDEPPNQQRFGMVETFVEEYDDDEDSELDHMIAAASRRSSSRSGSASSKPPNLDSFTEGLLKIGDIDPQGRRPSRTEESLQYFSAELAKRVESDRYNLRRESDLDRFAFDLFHGVNDEPPEQIRDINEDIAALCATRLAADIMQDVAIQMFGTVFPHSVRLIPAGEGFFPPRREPSETDLLSLAANLANTILESAMRTYRRDVLGNLSDGDSSESIGGELESEMNSRCAQIDENSVCDSTTDDIQRPRTAETYHFSSVDEMAWSISSTILSEAFVDISKVKLLEELFAQSLSGEFLNL